MFDDFLLQSKKNCLQSHSLSKITRKINGKMNVINCDANLAKENPVNTACKCNIGFYLSNNPS